MTQKKKLIEVALPLEAINKAAAREKSIRHGHPSTLHLWWARRPLAAARAVIFAQMVDDPSSHPDLFPTVFAQKKERQRLFKIIEELVQWENTTNEEVIQKARDAIWESWRRACAENAAHPNAKELFNREILPAFHDPFAGGGALPLEAQRLGLESFASDLNPVAILINKAMIEIPPLFTGRDPVNPEWQKKRNDEKAMTIWRGAQGLAEDVRHYGQVMRSEAEKRLKSLYPKIEVTNEMAKDRPDLTPYIGQKLNVIAWLWTRSVKSPNPAYSNIDVPLASTFMLSTKTGKEVYVEPLIEADNYKFIVKVGKPKDSDASKRGTKSGSSGSSFLCLMSGTPMPFDYLRSEAKAGRMGQRLMAVVAEGHRGRIYLPPTDEQEAIALSAQPIDPPETDLPEKALGFRIQEYGMTKWRDLFTNRQLTALTTFSDLVNDTIKNIKLDAISAGLKDDALPLAKGGECATAYAEAVGIYLGIGVSKLTDYNASLVQWSKSRDQAVHVFGRQALPMVWDYCEVNPFAGAAGDIVVTLNGISRTIGDFVDCKPGKVFQADAQSQTLSNGCCISTDPPYYDNIGYADLSDYFYVWLRRSLRSAYPELFSTMAVPKAEELVATPYRHGSKEKAELFFLDGMTEAMHRLAEQAHPAYPVTIYYAFKQSESDNQQGTTNTGWDTFLAAVIEAGFGIYGTWPMRTERDGRMVGNGTNSLASSIVLVCRKRPPDAPISTRREFISHLKNELPQALSYLQSSNIAPVDLAQAAIGPGMAVYTRYAKVLDAEGKQISVRAALALINQVLDEALAEQEGDFDSDTRWALAWFDQFGFSESDFGVADVLARAKATSVEGVAEAGIAISGKGKVRLLKPGEFPTDWDPTTDRRLTVWEMVHHLIRLLESGGESAAAGIVTKLGSKAEIARELCYRLYTICERKKRAQEAMAYNSLVQSWPEIVRISREAPGASLSQKDDLFNQE